MPQGSCSAMPDKLLWRVQRHLLFEGQAILARGFVEFGAVLQFLSHGVPQRPADIQNWPTGEMGTLKSRFQVNKLLATCVKKAKWAKAIRVFSEMQVQQMQPATVTINTTIRACERGSAWEEALHIFNQASCSGYPPLDVVSFTTAISACRHGGRWAEALQLLFMLQQEEQESHLHGLHMHEFEDPAVAALRREVPREARSEHTPGSTELPGFKGRQVDVMMWNACIAACEKAAQWTWAMHLLQRAWHVFLSPDLITYNSTMSSLARARRWNQALELWFEMDLGDHGEPSPVPWQLGT